MTAKKRLTSILAEWLNKFLKQKYSVEYNIEVIIPESNLSKITNMRVKRINGYSTFEFKPDILGILTHKGSDDTKLVLLNRSTSAISLKEIGEMYCYCKLVKPELSLIISSKGLPQELQLLFLDTNMERKVLYYNNNNAIVVVGWDYENNVIDSNSILPLDKRELFH